MKALRIHRPGGPDGPFHEEAPDPAPVTGDVLARSAAVVKPTGIVVSVVVPPPDRLDGGRTAFFVVEPDRAQLQELAARVDAGRLRAHVGAVYPLADGRAAFEVKQRGIPGKVVLQP